MATGGQFYWPSVGTFVAAYGQFFMAAYKLPLKNTSHGVGQVWWTRLGCWASENGEGRVRESGSGVPSRGTAWLASGAGIVGLVTVAALALMYGVEIPRHEEHRFFGPLSDWMSGVGTLLVGAVIVTMPWPARSPAGAVIGRGIVAVVSIVAALGSFLLVTGVIGFVSGTILALCGLVAQALWLALIPGRSARVGQIGRRKGATARWLGWAFLSGLVVVSVGFAFSSPALQWTFFIVGGVIGLIGWVGAPLWYLLLGLSAWRH